MMNQWRLLISLVLSLFIFKEANAERCTMIGCIGNIGYILVSPPQQRASMIFKQAGLPKVNGIAVIRKGPVSLVSPDTFSNEHYLEKIKSDIGQAEKNSETLSDWGLLLEDGAVVRVLGYSTFPQLGQASGALFMLVKVVRDNSNSAVNGDAKARPLP